VQVWSWREAISAIMIEQDHRPGFDIQSVGKRLVSSAFSLAKGAKKELRFGDIVQCEHKYEVARAFSAFLQQVNNEAVELVRGATPTDPFVVRVAAQA
jgi:condensin-2 complex subunit H2